MTRLSKQDNDTLRKQEWRMLFHSQQVTAIAGASASASMAASMGLPQEGLPFEHAQDTFLVKTFFSETETYYLILLTNLKQCWYEKLEIEAIRERSQSIKSFAYEEDSQLEALLVSLSAIFTAQQQDTGITPLDAKTKRHLEPHGEKLSLIVGFIYGIATVQWEFKLSPLFATSESVRTLLGDGLEHRPSSSTLKRKSTKTQDQATLPRRRNFLEDSDQEEEDDNDKELQRDHAEVDGMSVLYDHLILPLISLTNAYRRQAKSLETVIKAKENEVFEALEMLEQSGAGYHNRRRATERYDKARTETKLQEELEKQLRPQMLGPRELFSDRKVSALCSIVAKNAMEKDPSLASQGEMGPSQDQSMASQGSMPRTNTRTGVAEPSSTMTVPRPEGDSAASSGGEGPGTKASKRSEELERRRLLQERLDREKIEKERAPKKKKLF
ncbi:hypothetical protein BGZ70_009465 [Mortierella alpina]|uniref:Non-homologous end-joining factor 1 n=1 Tax=Mortierella alpina TaxID=64518 RepID=A0A9P6J1E5_MORAP|nr:hypothetical protein BGZ70_009465 [Mortierella alpina]